MNAEEQYRPLLQGIEGGLKGILKGILDESIADLDGPIREISQRLAMAARRNREDLVLACKDQLSLIVLERDLKIREGLGGFWRSIMSTGIDAVISGAVGGLGSVRR